MNRESKNFQRKGKGVLTLKNRGTMRKSPNPLTIQTTCKAMQFHLIKGPLNILKRTRVTLLPY